MADTHTDGDRWQDVVRRMCEKGGGASRDGLSHVAKGLGVSPAAVVRWADRECEAGRLRRVSTGLPGRQLGCSVYVSGGAA